MEQRKTALQGMAELPETLYHYTSMEGLLGIMKTSTVWASHIRYLNDRSEQEHLWSAIRNRIRNRLSEAPQGDVSEGLRRLLESSDQRSTRDTYVASFSGNGDLLSQWLSYCPSGNGFAIGFGRQSMINNNEVQMKRYNDLISASGSFDLIQSSFARVFYTSDDDIDFIDSFLDLYTGRTQVPIPMQETLPEPLKRLLMPTNITLNLLGFFEAFVKDKSFSAEEECRLILRGRADKPLFRPGRSMLIPYCEYELNGGGGYFIETVIVGPCPEPDLSVRSVKLLLESMKQSSVQVIKSKIPYRSW